MEAPSRGTRRQPEAAAPTSGAGNTANRFDAASQSYRTCSIAEIPIFVHTTLPVLFLVIMLMYTVRWGGAGFGYGFLYCCILFGTVLVHELGHSFAAKRIKCQVDRILV